MNGLIPNDTGTNRANPPIFTSAHLTALLQGATKTPKIIAGAERGVFDIDCDDVENFFHLIEQRVKDQQHCSLNSFEVSIYFNNGSSIRLGGIEEFRAYAQTKNIAPTVISFHWVLMLQFPDTEELEKQEIDITLRASEIPSEAMDIVESEDSYRMSGDKIQLKVLSGGEKGVFAYSINHTRITWGLDVENIIRTHIGKILEKPTGFDKIVRRIAGPLNLFTTVFVGLYITNLLIDLFFYFLLTSEDPENGQTVMEIASAYLVNGHIAKYIVASLVVSVVVFVLFSALVSRAFQNFIKPKPSFIILSKFDEVTCAP